MAPNLLTNDSFFISDGNILKNIAIIILKGGTDFSRKYPINVLKIQLEVTRNLQLVDNISFHFLPYLSTFLRSLPIHFPPFLSPFLPVLPSLPISFPTCQLPSLPFPLHHPSPPIPLFCCYPSPFTFLFPLFLFFPLHFSLF